MDVNTILTRINNIETEIADLRRQLETATGARETLLIGSIERAEATRNDFIAILRQQTAQPYYPGQYSLCPIFNIF